MRMTQRQALAQLADVILDDIGAKGQFFDLDYAKKTAQALSIAVPNRNFYVCSIPHKPSEEFPQTKRYLIHDL